MNKSNKRTICVEVVDDSPFDFGQKLYVVTTKKWNGYTVFNGKCPICDDKKEIKLKGYTFKCPLCQAYIANNSATRIEIYNYEVREYIINHVEIQGVNYKNAYSENGRHNDKNLPAVKWYGFDRYGTSFTESHQFSSDEIQTSDPDKLDIKKNLSGQAFFSKADAARFCKRLHERQKELLTKFNAEHGTEHEYPFEY